MVKLKPERTTLKPELREVAGWIQLSVGPPLSAAQQQPSSTGCGSSSAEPSCTVLARPPGRARAFRIHTKRGSKNWRHPTSDLPAFAVFCSAMHLNLCRFAQKRAQVLKNTLCVETVLSRHITSCSTLPPRPMRRRQFWPPRLAKLCSC